MSVAALLLLVFPAASAERILAVSCGGSPRFPRTAVEEEARWTARVQKTRAYIRLGYDLRRGVKRLFAHWADYRAGTISQAAFVRRLAPVRREVERLLLRGAGSGSRSIAGMCRELYDHHDWLWGFVRVEGVEPTSNASGRALRHAVIWRKLSFGTQSADGGRFVETMLTVIETCRQQNQNAFHFVTEAVQTRFARQKIPSLLPEV